MMKQQCLDDCLEEIYQVIETSNVCEFVCEDHFYLLWRHLGEDAGGDEYHRSEPSDCHWRLYNRRLQEANRAFDTEALSKITKHACKLFRCGCRSDTTQSAHGDPAAEVPDAHRKDAEKPCDNRIRLPWLDGVCESLLPLDRRR